MTKEWFVWSGGECPVDRETLVDVKLRNGDAENGTEAVSWDWSHTDNGSDIVFWCPHQPEQPAWNGNSLPPVGTECEVAKHLHNAGTKVRVLCHDEGAAVCRVIDGDDLHDLCQLEAFEISPIRTKAERQREEVIDSIANLCHRGDPGDDATAIYDAIAAGKIPGVKLDS